MTTASPVDILATASRRFPDSVALRSGDRAFTYAELNSLSDAVARSLAARGVTPGHVVSIYSQNCWEWIVSYHGILKAGAVVNPVNIMLTADELGYVLADCAAQVLFVGAEATQRIADNPASAVDVQIIGFGSHLPSSWVGFTELLSPGEEITVPQPAPEDLCTIGYTSGTTGHPKGAMQSHQAVYLNCAHTATMHGRTDTDVVVTALPAPHVYGNVVINSTFLAGGTVVLMERFDPAAALELIESHRATMFEGVPTMYALMLEEQSIGDADLSSLTRCTVGGQTMPEDTINRWVEKSQAPLLELWGMTELSGLGLTHTPHTPYRPGKAGISLPGTAVRIADLSDDSREAPLGQPGELQIRGPLVMLGYHGNPEATDEAINPDGWLRTGDIAKMDPEGYVSVVDRRKDMIITAGYNVYPAEIERVLSSHPDVALVAVGPVPDNVRGELACAYIVPAKHTQPTEEDLIAFAGKHLAAYKRPRMVRFVESLPTTSSGKVMRRKLSEWPDPEE